MRATRSRKQKIAALSSLLSELPPEELEIGVAWLTGELRQGKIGVGWAAVRDAAPGTAAEAPSLTLPEVDAALSEFHAAVAEAGAPHLRVELSEIRLDDKHLRAVEFDLARGRHRAIVVAKAKGEITLVGPFKQGKVEGPCLSFPFDARDDIQRALGDFLERFLEEAATP